MRNMLFSGLSSELQKKYPVSIITHQNNERLKSVARENHLEIIDIPRVYLQKKRLKIEGYFLASRRAKLRLDNNKSFRLMTAAPKIRKKDHILSNNLLYAALQKLTWDRTQKNYFDKQIAEIIEKNGLTDVIIQGYSTPEAMIIGVTASKMGCRVWVINWSWKDFYINEYIPFKINGFFTWSDELKKNYILYNKHLDSSLFESIGNLSFDKLYNYQPSKELTYYSKKYGFETDKKIILYSLVIPTLYGDEHKLIHTIYETLENGKLAGNFTLLMKPNPMDKDLTRLYEMQIPGRLITLENLWEYDSQNDFNMITEEGQTEWLDLIYYSNLNLSVASTVTIEFLIMNKPVVNILFDATLQVNEDFKRLYNAPYYSSCKNLKKVKPATNLEELSDAVINFARDIDPNNEINNIIKVDGSSIKHFLDIINY
jgi:hypothetical protein